jgi:hypothetical protein
MITLDALLVRQKAEINAAIARQDSIPSLEAMIHRHAAERSYPSTTLPPQRNHDPSREVCCSMFCLHPSKAQCSCASTHPMSAPEPSFGLHAETWP